jgi:hypothetical protein
MRVRAERVIVLAGIDALGDGGLPPVGPLPVRVLAHVDARRVALLGVLVGWAVREVFGYIEGVVVPFFGAGQGCRCGVWKVGETWARVEREDTKARVIERRRE